MAAKTASVAQQLDAFLQSKGSPLAGLGDVFAAAGEHYGVDPKLLVSIAGGESDFGKYEPIQSIHNPFGYGPNIKFSSWTDAIDTVARSLKTNYIDQGLTTIPEIQKKWAPVHAANDPTGLNANWIRNVSSIYDELGGSTPTGTRTPAPTAAVPAPITNLAAGTTAPASASSDPLGLVLASILQSNDQRIGIPSLNPLLLEGLSQTSTPTPTAAAPATKPTATVAPSGAPAVLTSQGLVDPVTGKIIGTPYQGTHAKAFNVKGGSDNWESENAVDVSVPIGTPVKAVTSGTIGSQFGSLGTGGRFAGLRLHLVSPSDEYYYAHLSKFAAGIKPGATVKAGQIIGYSGEADGVPHLHLAFKTGNPLQLYKS